MLKSRAVLCRDRYYLTLIRQKSRNRFAFLPHCQMTIGALWAVNKRRTDCGPVRGRTQIRRIFPIRGHSGSVAYAMLPTLTDCRAKTAYCYECRHGSLMKICRLARIRNLRIRTSLPYTQLCVLIRRIGGLHAHKGSRGFTYNIIPCVPENLTLIHTTAWSNFNKFSVFSHCCKEYDTSKKTLIVFLTRPNHVAAVSRAYTQSQSLTKFSRLSV